MLVERGATAPRTLAAAFLKPVAGEDILAGSIGNLAQTRENFAKAYAEGSGASAEMNVPAGKGTLAEVIACATA